MKQLTKRLLTRTLRVVYPALRRSDGHLCRQERRGRNFFY